MKRLIFITLLLLTTCIYPQTVTIKHINYTSTFDTIKMHPIKVKYWVTRSMVNCDAPLKRSNSYRVDTKLAKYTNLRSSYYKSGFDRGHNMPASINECEGRLIERQSFYYTNITPQYSSLNKGSWRNLEKLVQYYTMKYDSILVFTGSFGEIKKIGKVTVPKYFWKVIYFKITNSYASYIFENSKNDKINGRNGKFTTVCKIQNLTNLKIKL